MAPLTPGSAAPAIDGVDLSAGPTALFFYKVTCPVCQMAAPKVEAFERGYPGRIVGIGEDPDPLLVRFAEEHGMTFPSIADEPPYPASNAYGVRSVPTLFVIDADGTIVETVESWDRDRLNEASRRMADLIGSPSVPISVETDGLPPFRPG
jgi:peroxiredoxin